MPALHDVVTKGSIDRSVVITMADATDGTPELGVVFDTAGLDLWYRREGGARVALTEVTLAALTTAHTDGGFLHISDGNYRVDLPDAAYATGANYVDFGGACTGMVIIGGRVRLVDYNLEDGANLGLTTLSTLLARIVGTIATGTHQPQSGDAYTRLGAPTGASVSADIATRLAPTVAGRTLDVSTGGEAGLDWANIGSPTTTVALSGTTIGVVTVLNSLATGIITAASIAAGALNGKGDWNIGKTGYALSAAGVQALWDALTSALTTANSIGKLLADNVNATISSRATQTSVDDVPTNAEFSTALASANDATLSSIAAMQADVDTLQTRLPTTLDTGRIRAVAEVVSDKTGYALSTAGANAVRDAVTGDIIETEGSYTLQQALSIILAAVSGETDTGGAVFRTPNGTTVRITATVNGSNERTAMSLTPSS